MSDLVQVTRDGEIAIITINNPPVNALSPGVPEGIGAALDIVAADPQTRAAVLIGGGRTFIAGADIREFQKITSGERDRDIALNPLLSKIEDCPKPIVMAIHGAALGGGLEVAMSGHYRVASPDAQVGQPEVKLGLIPGAGGTQRLPRLAGVAKALQMCAEGNPIKAEEAHQVGIVDRLIEVDLLAGAVAFARGIAVRAAPKTRGRNEKLADKAANAAAVAIARESVEKRFRNMLAPVAAIDAVEAATMMPFEDGLAEEARLFLQCLFSSQSKALIHVFFGEREVAKIRDIPKDTPVRPVNSVGVVGAGTMGAGIAMSFANAGIPVIVKDTSQPSLDRGLETIRRNYASTVRKGRLSQAEADRRLALIQPTLSYDGFEAVDMVVEAVFESMALKKQIFEELDRVAKPDAILATNTSTLDVDEIAASTYRPDAVIGTHFFSPANVMKLVEVVRGRATSKDVIQTCMQLGRRLGKIGVLVGNCRGFVGNRMFAPYLREAQFLVEEGASPRAVDRALYDFGMAMGPLATGDLAGLDVGWRIRREHAGQAPPGVRQPRLEDRLCEMGRYGQKTGAGWYRYDENRHPSIDPEIERLVRRWSEEAGIPQRDISSEELVDRCILALVNEGARVLDEGYAMRAVDIDIIYIYGYGFPAYRGGPMWYADARGLKEVYERIREFERQQGELWTPAPLLAQLAEEGKTFSQLNTGRRATA